MEKINAINIPFYKFKTSAQLNQDVLSNLESLDFLPETKPEYGYIYSDYFHEKLFDFFDDCIKQVAKIYYQQHLEFPIVDCWVNKYTKLNVLRKHKHPNSIISGVYYATTHDKDGYTKYKCQNPWTKDCMLDDKINIANNDIIHDITGSIGAESGTLILFPPNIVHYMDAIKISSHTRYTIAFNTFVSGNISSHTTSKLEIKTTSLRDKKKGQNI